MQYCRLYTDFENKILQRSTASPNARPTSNCYGYTSLCTTVGPSIKYVTMFLTNFDPPLRCHIKYVTHLGPPFLAAVHKVRHAIFTNFTPSVTPSVTLCHTSRNPPKVRHTSRTHPPIFSRSSTKTRTKAPYTNSLSIVRGVLSGGFVRGSIVWKVLSGVFLSVSPSVEIYLLQQKVKYHFTFHVSYV